MDGVRVASSRGTCARSPRSAPAEFVQHARNPERSVRIGGDATVFSPAYGCPFVMDLDKGRRYGSPRISNFVKLAYASPWLHHSSGTVRAGGRSGQPSATSLVHAHIRYSDKAFMGW